MTPVLTKILLFLSVFDLAKVISKETLILFQKMCLL